MTDGFLWHPEARLYDSTGRDVQPVGALQGTNFDPPSGRVFPDTAQGLASAVGRPAFRIGALDQPPPKLHDCPILETLTSGSTGQPRRIRRTQASWIASFKVNARLGIGGGSRLATLGRLVHSLSLYGAIEGLHLGAEVHLLADLRPDRQRAALRDRRITHLYATPAQLRLILGPETLADLRLILVGGSKLDPALRGALGTLAPHVQIREFYGAAETSFVTLADETTRQTSVGRPFPGVDLRLDQNGEVWVKSPYLFLGYADQPAAERCADRSQGRDGEQGGSSSTRWRDGWLSVGEIGILQNGDLFLKGRAGRMVTVADQNVFPEEIEELLLTLPGVTRAAVLPIPDPIRGHVLIAGLQGDRAQEPRILSDLRRILGPLKSPKRVVWLEGWPVLASGKTDLRALEAMLWPA